MSCDVYVLESPGCDRVWVYPSAVHPHPTPAGGPAGGRYTYDFMGEGPVIQKKKQEDDEALALILIEWIRNAE